MGLLHESHHKMMQPPTKYRAAVAKTRIVITERWRDEFVDILLEESPRLLSQYEPTTGFYINKTIRENKQF